MLVSPALLLVTAVSFWHAHGAPVSTAQPNPPGCVAVVLDYVPQAVGIGGTAPGADAAGVCHIQLDPAFAAQDYDACRMAIHEFGHLLYGPDHSPDPASVMYAVPTTVPPICSELSLRLAEQRQAALPQPRHRRPRHHRRLRRAA